MTDPLELLVSALTGTTAGAAAVKWGPKLARAAVGHAIGAISGRAAKDAAAPAKPREIAQARRIEDEVMGRVLARVDARLEECEQGRTEDAEARARDKREAEEVREQDRRECLEREAKLAGQVSDLRALVVRRLRPSPSNPDHAPLDPSITPIAGTRVDEDPTPDLHARPTPVPTDPPGRR